MVRQLVTSRDYDIILVTLQSSMSSHWETTTRINCPRGPFKLSIAEHCVKNQL